MSNMPTLKKVASLAKVDPSTVSRVLRRDPAIQVRPETRTRILQAAKQLNYTTNILARSLKMRQTQSLALMLPNISNPVHYEIARGVQDASYENDFTVFICQVDQNSIQSRSYHNLLQERRVDGLIIATAKIHDKAVDALVKSESPFILTNRRTLNSSSYVIVDDAAGSQMAVDHLVSLGHKRIAYLSGNIMFNNALRRMQGYRRGLHEHGIPFDNDLVEEGDLQDWVGGKKSMGRLLAKAKFTAVLASNLVLATGAMSSLREAGIDVPKDISVIGLHDFPMAEVLVPPLTVVKMPLYEMGYRATLALISLLKGTTTTITPEVLPPDGLVKRSSTGVP